MTKGKKSRPKKRKANVGEERPPQIGVQKQYLPDGRK